MAPEGALWLIRTASVCASTPPLCASRGRRVRAWGLHHGSRLCVKMDFAYLQHTPAPGVAQLEPGLDCAALRRPRPHETNLTRAIPLTGSPHAPQICVKMDFGSTPHTPAPGDGHLESELDWAAPLALARLSHAPTTPCCSPGPHHCSSHVRLRHRQTGGGGLALRGSRRTRAREKAWRARADLLGSTTTTVGSDASVAAAASAWPRGA